MRSRKWYTYTISNSELGKWYIGYRGSFVSPDRDTTYWGSSRTLKELMTLHPDGWVKKIDTTHSSKLMAQVMELSRIKLAWGDPNLLNRSRNTYCVTPSALLLAQAYGDAHPTLQRTMLEYDCLLDEDLYTVEEFIAFCMAEVDARYLEERLMEHEQRALVC